MNRSKLTIAEFLFQCGLRINNSLNDSKVQEAVSVFGYTAERLEAGRNILDASNALNETFVKEYGELDAAYEQRNEAKDLANFKFQGHLAVARIVFKSNPSASTALALNKPLPRTNSEWFTRSRAFYNNLLSNAEWLAAMADYNAGEEMLKSVLADIQGVENYSDVIMREKGDAQNATKERDAKLEELNEWVNDYESIAKIALNEKPQLLEKLGIVVK
ncbi:hypothetical protein [Carboxylicivirga marina]|uniref:Cyclic nucleotide-binding domain-containing protein n=1 Tax=Carboxylicivirga marina TaxID=2800988 RepID=A0ABS1HDM9_9BACT|nr:hypothetical protein [Carboxylicivirga marina]MBK3515733.1 hypothetical protein [Carboxylicivirga marina]